MLRAIPGLTSFKGKTVRRLHQNDSYSDASTDSEEFLFVDNASVLSTIARDHLYPNLPSLLQFLAGLRLPSPTPPGTSM
ncbi:hypothetical protein EDD85DRAFT_953438 [Armillaria nabsnona]|nr:hypothetical protein EDD85DRAFT_953438 [Armillaria nabsnona]